MATPELRGSGPVILRRLIAVMAVGALALLPWAGNPPTAFATELAPTLTGATFTHAWDNDGDGEPDPVTPEDPLIKDTAFFLGIDFTLPVPLAVGDTFSIEFPEEIRGAVNAGFDLRDQHGVAIGTCTVGPDEFDCRLTNPVVATWDVTAPFHVFFLASADSVTTETTLPFTVKGGGTFVLEGPDGGIVIGAGTPLPTKPRKEGWPDQTKAGQMQWVVYLQETSAAAIRFTDTLGSGEGQDLVPGSIRVYRTANWNPHNIYESATQYAASELDIELGGDLQSFSIEFDTVPGSIAYWVAYSSTVPPDVKWGDTFSNTVEGENISIERTEVYQSNAGGTGGGSPLPDLRIAKTAVNEPSERTYSFTLTCTLGNQTFSYTTSTAAGEFGLIRDLPIGARCTITEDDSFGGQVSFDPSDTITITEDTAEVVTVTATNTWPTPTPTEPTPTAPTPTTPTPPTTVEPTEPPEPTAPVPTVESEEPTLPMTGADGSWTLLLAIGLVAVVAGTGFTVVTRQRS